VYIIIVIELLRAGEGIWGWIYFFGDTYRKAQIQDIPKDPFGGLRMTRVRLYCIEPLEAWPICPPKILFCPGNSRIGLSLLIVKFFDLVRIDAVLSRMVCYGCRHFLNQFNESNGT